MTGEIPMDEQASVAASKLQDRFGGDIVEVREFRDETTVVVAAERIHEVCVLLRHDPELSFSMLIDVTAADYVQQRHAFAVVYHLYSLTTNTRLRLKADVPADAPRLRSVADVWPAADWHERETYDMFGIEFEGHPDLRRILMDEDYEYHPLRKDFPLHGK